MAQARVEVVAQCVFCQHKEVLTAAQVEQAQRDNAPPACSRCTGPMATVAAKVKAVRRLSPS